jgi:hypothetical protein
MVDSKCTNKASNINYKTGLYMKLSWKPQANHESQKWSTDAPCWSPRRKNPAFLVSPKKYFARNQSSIFPGGQKAVAHNIRATYA